MTRDEIEAERIERLELLDREGPVWRERFAPGTCGCHEALHMASLAQAFVEANLVDHPAIQLDPHWFELASRANAALADLYQAIGRHDGVLECKTSTPPPQDVIPPPSRSSNLLRQALPAYAPPLSW